MLAARVLPRAQPSAAARASRSLARSHAAPPQAQHMAAAAAGETLPKLKLTYFDIKARAEPTRLALHIAGIPFEDVRLSHDAWKANSALKASTPFGQIPVRALARVRRDAQLRRAVARAARGGLAARWRSDAQLRRSTRHNRLTALSRLHPRRAQVLEVDGVTLAQSYAILMYAGRLAKLVPTDPVLHAQARRCSYVAHTVWGPSR